MLIFYSREKSIARKTSIEKFPSLVLPRNTIMLQQLIIQFPLYYSICQVVTYRRLETRENFKLLTLKVVSVTYERWSLARGSRCSDLTRKLLVFWKTGR